MEGRRAWAFVSDSPSWTWESFSNDDAKHWNIALTWPGLMWDSHVDSVLILMNKCTSRGYCVPSHKLEDKAHARERRNNSREALLLNREWEGQTACSMRTGEAVTVGRGGVCGPVGGLEKPALDYGSVLASLVLMKHISCGRGTDEPPSHTPLQIFVYSLFYHLLSNWEL